MGLGGIFGASWVRLGASRGCLECVLGCPGIFLGRLLSVLGCYGASRRHLLLDVHAEGLLKLGTPS